MTFALGRRFVIADGVERWKDADADAVAAALAQVDGETLTVAFFGRENPYGHRAPSTLAALRSVPHVFRTDRDGTIRLRVRDGRIRLEPD